MNLSRNVYVFTLFAKSGSRNSTHNTWNTHARVIHYMGNWCYMVDRYRCTLVFYRSFYIFTISINSSSSINWLYANNSTLQFLQYHVLISICLDHICSTQHTGYDICVYNWCIQYVCCVSIFSCCKFYIQPSFKVILNPAPSLILLYHTHPSSKIREWRGIFLGNPGFAFS